MQLSMRSQVPVYRYFPITLLYLYTLLFPLLIVSCDHNYHYYLDICDESLHHLQARHNNDYDNLYNNSTVVVVVVLIDCLYKLISSICIVRELAQYFPRH